MIRRILKSIVPNLICKIVYRNEIADAEFLKHAVFSFVIVFSEYYYKSQLYSNFIYHVVIARTYLLLGSNVIV